MVIRTFFDKDNTIIYNREVNLGRNPVTEIYYGGNPNSHSRYIFHFDETKLVEEYQCGKISNLSDLTHTLKMTATAGLNEQLLGTENIDGKERTCSFNLIVFKINEPWDEGVGFDARGTEHEENAVVSMCPSNWIFAKTNIPWTKAGIIDNTGTTTGMTDYINHQEFDLGNEDIEIDITDVVNGIITGDTNYGFGIAFSGNVETLETNTPRFVSFFGKDTNTFFEPYIETINHKVLKDKRNDFTLGIPQQICIYPTINGEDVCLDNLPSVIIKDGNGNEVINIPSSGVSKIYSGAYCVDINLTGVTGTTDCVTYTDTWSGLTYNGLTIDPITNEFFVNPERKVTFGTTSTRAKEYIVTVVGIKRDEKILSGDIRKVVVNAKIPYTSNQQQTVDNMEYRLYVKEGPSEYTVIDYHPIDMTPELNFFYLDTNSLIPNTYYLDIRVKSNGQIKQLKENLRFDIVNQANNRNSYGYNS